VKERFDSLIDQMVANGVFFQDAVAELERGFLRRVLEMAEGNQVKAAKMLGIHRNTLRKKIADYQLEHAGIRRSAPSRK
jgi:DNA-binding protein Fis